MRKTAYPIFLSFNLHRIAHLNPQQRTKAIKNGHTNTTISYQQIKLQFLITGDPSNFQKSSLGIREFFVKSKTFRQGF